MREAMHSLNTLVGSIVEDRYEIQEELGAGAMGVVYRGRHLKVGRTVAIKVLHDHLVKDPSMVERFEDEARAVARLRHRNLVGVLDVGVTDDGQRCMVLEFAPGCSMAKLVTVAMKRERVIALVRQLLLGLEHAHEAGLVHRDLKPENVLVERSADGTEIPRIVDFGIAQLRDRADRGDGRRHTTDGLVVGTPMYMSPEQARGEAVDERTDLFALGVMVYEMLAGCTPFEGSGVEVMMLNIMQDPPSIATRTGRDVDAQLEAFARKLMARDKADRYASATDALAALDAIASNAVPRPVVDNPTVRHRTTRITMPALKR
ncbi:MAG TPA: serine/threonine-protein kinase [Kofleriaceae bacterium]|nr:serine/threonine-protein kinase [Kofleriaceae bacterium]